MSEHTTPEALRARVDQMKAEIAVTARYGARKAHRDAAEQHLTVLADVLALLDGAQAQASREASLPDEAEPLQEIVRRRIDQHGGVRPAARAMQIDPGYLIRLLNGTKDAPSAKTLRWLGVERRTVYVDRSAAASDRW